ncbi:MAG: FitA-like ribbon-helix-helix domain-containing protein [Wenzhouxiangella sp.]
MIQIRNVPVQVHRALKARAALAGKSMSELILEELQAMLALPSEQELRERLAQAEPFAMAQSSAGLIRRERDAA